MTCVTGLKEVHSDLCVTGLMEVHSDSGLWRYIVTCVTGLMEAHSDLCDRA